MEQESKVSILVVDDRPEKVLALSAVLEELGERVVCAYSGREALRHLLNEEFAVILLDVNMPGMDGFETASLVRQRQNLQHVPIIFITAYQDELQLARGYSLGAVDYIQAPVVPEILRTKVKVFVDLFRKTAQVERQAASLRHRAEQLHRLTAASLAISAAMSIEKLLMVAGEAARELVGAHASLAAFVLDDDWSHAKVAQSRPAAHAESARSPGREFDEPAFRPLVCRSGKAMRLTRRELGEHPAWPPAHDSAISPPPNGWLAVPLAGRDGRSLGLIEVSDHCSGDFGIEDEAILVQLAQLVSIAIENTLFAQEREANRMKDEFLWTLSHELRTPLNAILGWTQLLNREALSEDVAHGLEVIERNARAQVQLVDDMLDMSRITMGTLRLSTRPLELGPVILAAADTIRPAAEMKQVRLECRISSSPVGVQGDPDRLQQIVWNLLTNAVKFTPSGGRVSVTMERLGAQAVICVSDTGQGIKPSFLPHVFDRFRQADSSTTRAHTGLGLGLTIVRHLVELHGGMVRAESAGEGRGATFTVMLPASIDAPHPEPGGSETETEVGLNQPVEADLTDIRVLLVDDEADARAVVEALLRRLNARVTSAGSVPEALEAIKQLRPDVLISDIAMPGEDGYCLIRAVRQLPVEAGGGTPAIAMTAYAREEDRVRSMSAGFQMHLSKPVEATALTAAVLRLASQVPGVGAPQHVGHAILPDVPAVISHVASVRPAIGP